MDIILLHAVDALYLVKIKKEMRTLGSPTIHAVKDDANNMWVALEGTHRLKAAEELGILVNIEAVEYCDTQICEYKWSDMDNDYMVSTLADDAPRRYNEGLFVSVDCEEL